MSKKKNQIFSEQELREFYDSLPEISKRYLSKNMKHLTPLAFVNYILGVIHGSRNVIETIVEPHIKKTDEILNDHH
jgi:hypothetical protein